jgi:hypothetical protein
MVNEMVEIKMSPGEGGHLNNGLVSTWQ